MVRGVSVGLAPSVRGCERANYLPQCWGRLCSFARNSCTSPGENRPTLASAVHLFVRSHRLGKTFIGRISRSFDFLGYAFTPAGLEAAPVAIERCVRRVSQLYEQGVDLIHIGAYVRRWLRWARSGLRELGEGLCLRAEGNVVRSLVRLGMLDGIQPSLMPAVVEPTAGNEGDGSDHRYDGGGGLGDRGGGADLDRQGVSRASGTPSVSICARPQS